MQCDQNLLQNFPNYFNPHTRGSRELFYDYGTPLVTDVEPHNLLDGTTDISFVYQKQLSCNNTDLTLVPRGPCRPIISPNPYFNIEKEPCMYDLHEENKETDELLSFLFFSAFYTKSGREEQIELYKKRLKKIERFENGVKEHNGCHTVDSDSVYLGSKADKRFMSVAGITRRRGDIFQDYSLAWRKDYNPSYAGGCLAFQSIDEGNDLDGILVFPTGKRMDSIALGVASFKNESELILKDDFLFKYKLDSLVYQVTLETVKNRIFCLARTKNEISYFGIVDNDDKAGGDLRLNHLMTSEWDGNKAITHAALSPHLIGEFLISSEDGGAYLWSLERSSRREIYRVPASSNPIQLVLESHPTHVHFTGHPRCFLISTNDSLIMADARAPQSSILRLIALSDNDSFDKIERITCSHRPNLSSPHHLFASQLSLCAIDERFPQHLLLKWNHSLLTSPAFINSIQNVMGIENETLVTLASQDHGEVHCFQCHGVAAVGMEPCRVQICGPPWRTCRPSELLTSSLRGIKKRLTCPLIGQCLVPNHSQKGFSILQVSSVGDVFSQEYQGDQVPTNNSKLFSRLSDRHSTHDLDGFREQLESWLSECHAFMNDHRSTNEFQHWSGSRKRLQEEYVNVTQRNKRKKLDGSNFNGCIGEDVNTCHKCLTGDRNPDFYYDDFDPKCEKCKKLLRRHAQKEDKLPHSSEDADLSALQSRVPFVLNENDVEGRILMSQYNGEDYQDLLRMRDEQTMADVRELTKDRVQLDDEALSDLELADDAFKDDDDDDDENDASKNSDSGLTLDS